MKSDEHSVRVQFEIGHEASLKSKKTQEGFTHDWEVFVRGADNTDIQYFVDKVVFHLHETFLRPKRVVKEPPYSVKESGYAGFILPIDVYLRNKEEPKKIKFQYDLNLQTSGPPISRVLREPRVFQNPSEDFRRKLIRGGGVGVDTLPDDIKQVNKTSVKKQKQELPLSNSFADLFGTPIRRVTPEPKKVVPTNNTNSTSSTSNVKKIDKHSSRKEKDKDKTLDKSKEKTKEKTKRPLSPPPASPPPPIVKQKHDERKHEKVKEDKKHSREEKQEEESRKEKSEIVKEKDVNRKEIKLYEREVEKEKSEKHKRKHKKKEKEREKEKQKKDEVKEKEKKRKHVEENVREKSRKRSRSRSISPVTVEKIKKRPLSALLQDVNSSYSPSSMSDDEESVSSSTTKPTTVVPEVKPHANVNSKSKSTNLNTSNEDTNKKPDSSKHKKKNKKVEEKKKRREKSASSEREVEKVVMKKEQEEKVEKVDKDAEKSRKEKRHKKEKVEKSTNDEIVVKKKEIPSQSGDIESSKCDKFTKEYVAQLRDLQHRIMTLEDTSELQKVVKVIAETGLYEITKKTFDFDLCDLDVTTVKKLQDFFAMS